MPKTWKYPFSKGMLERMIEKMRLERGDVLVVKDYETMQALSKQRLSDIDFPVPLVFAPGGIQKLSRADLLNLLEQVEERDKSVLEPYGVTEQGGAPL